MDMNEEVDIVHDAEATGLMDDTTIDYTASPWKPRDNFKMHVIAVREFPSGNLLAFYDGPTIVLDGRYHEVTIEGETYTLSDYEPLEYRHFPLRKFKDYVSKRKIRTATAHNGINFDLLSYKVLLDMDYVIGDTPEEDSWCGRPVYHNDTLVQSKCQNPDRFGGHSLEHLSKLAGGDLKQNFRPWLKGVDKFKHFAADMLYYNLFDVKSNYSVKVYLDKEADGHNWSEAIQLEKCTQDIVTQQSHRGFHYNQLKAQQNVAELDAMMEERRVKVEPVLPPKKATKKFLNDFTPPKRQFKKDGTTAADFEKFIAKIGAQKIVDEASGWLTHIVFDGKTIPVPLDPDVPLRTHDKATINDTTHIKEWLVSLEWSPSEYKEKDLSLKSGTKIKLTDEEYEAAVERYVEQTLNSSFCADRCEFLETSPEGLRAKLLGKRKGRGMRVRTNPSFTVGQEKEMCRNLDKMVDKFPFAKDVVEYLTFKHRRNSILGGGADWDEDEEPEKGFMASVRSDGRIPTPADTCGAATSRMKHRVVANVPRVTSLYGEPMRELFEADPEMCYQIGYDFSSLEARMEGHYCFDHEKPTAAGVREYCESLLQEKPHDVHTKTAQQISFLLGRDFARGDAKAVKYGCVPVDNTEVLTPFGWKKRAELNIGDMVLSYNKERGGYEYTAITKLWDYQDAVVGRLANKWFSVEVTEDHEWLVRQRKTIRVDGAKTKVFEVQKRATKNLTTESNIIGSAKSLLTSTFTNDECSFIGWLLSDGYYKWTNKARNKVMGITVSIDQSEKKYVDEIRHMLSRQTVFAEYVTDNGMHKFVPNLNYTRSLLAKVGVAVGVGKHEHDWSAWVGNLSEENLVAFLEAFSKADGHKKGAGWVIKQNQGYILEAVKLAINMTGHMAYSGGSSCSTTYTGGSQYVTGQRLTWAASRTTDVFCLSNANESFVIRQGGQITLTGNCTYGAQAAKVAKTIGSDLATGQAVFDAFWQAALPLKKLKEALQKHWEKNGKKYILTIDNRKVPTRAAHSILNSLFQSAGVICAKRTMVVWMRKMREAGLTVDFWRDDWKQKSWAQQMIAYHK